MQIKLSEKVTPGAYLCLICCFRMSLEHTTENKASMSGPLLVSVEFAQDNTKNYVAETLVRVFLFVSARVSPS